MIDNENPVIFGCPSDQNVNTDSGSATAVVTWRQPRATDNSGNHTLTSYLQSWRLLSYWKQHSNLLYASDDAGKTETCTFFVVVSGKCLCYALLSKKQFCILLIVCA